MTNSRSGPTGGGGRSVTRIPDVTSRRVNDKLVTVEFDPRTFVPIGAHAASFRSYLGSPSLRHVEMLLDAEECPICSQNSVTVATVPVIPTETVATENWDISNDERIRKKILSHIAVRWRDFKTRMTRQYVFGSKQKNTPYKKYKITKEEWVQFKESRLTPKWQVKRIAAQQRQKLNDTPHVLSNGGYALLEKNMRKRRAEELGLDSHDLAPPPARHELWKATRTKSNGQSTSQTAQEISQRIVSGNLEYLLVAATGRLDRLGRVRAVGGATRLRDYFRPKPRSTAVYRPEKQPMAREEVEHDDPLFILTSRLNKLRKGRYMDTIVVESGRASVYGFLEPQTMQPFGNTLDFRKSYIQTWMTESNRERYIAPYIDAGHWQLMVIIPKKAQVVWFCSLHRKINAEFKSLTQIVVTRTRGQQLEIIYPKVRANEIQMCASTINSKAPLGHPSLITHLCKLAGVDTSTPPFERPRKAIDEACYRQYYGGEEAAQPVPPCRSHRERGQTQSQASVETHEAEPFHVRDMYMSLIGAQLQSIHRGQVATAEMIVGMYDTPPAHRWTMDEFHNVVAWREEQAQGDRVGAAEVSAMEKDEDGADDDAFEDAEDEEEEEDADDNTD
ncbi:hypothetical protein LR48_Vigan05g114500 [Vigna angularis]|uniref:Ubiquitin-like protease family profile domain-containing protein n=1 Tax=Phaseolus angularis TaxID=3914 RepID=A0A0L9ULH5_PHAAN|nr:hypothetical protein LR48_Vigan05g114500 [Vigna angularis]